MTPDQLRARNALHQRAWRLAHPDRARQLTIAKPSYTHVTGESLGLMRPMTRQEVGLFALARRLERAPLEDAQ